MGTQGTSAAAGMTMIELMVVLLILGLAAMAALPALTRSRPAGTRVVVDSLGALLASTREHAVVRGQETALRIELRSGAYWLTAERAAGDGEDTLAAATLPLPPGTALRGGQGGWAGARFTPLRRARADPITITEGERSHVVIVDPWTAAVSAH